MNEIWKFRDTYIKDPSEDMFADKGGSLVVGAPDNDGWRSWNQQGNFLRAWPEQVDNRVKVEYINGDVTGWVPEAKVNWYAVLKFKAKDSKAEPSKIAKARMKKAKEKTDMQDWPNKRVGEVWLTNDNKYAQFVADPKTGEAVPQLIGDDPRWHKSLKLKHAIAGAKDENGWRTWHKGDFAKAFPQRKDELVQVKYLTGEVEEEYEKALFYSWAEHDHYAIGTFRFKKDDPKYQSDTTEVITTPEIQIINDRLIINLEVRACERRKIEAIREVIENFEEIAGGIEQVQEIISRISRFNKDL